MLNLSMMAISPSAETRVRARYMIATRLRGLDLRDTSPEDYGLDPEIAVRYTDSGGPELASILRQLPIGPEDLAIDLGCGKGGAIITMARYLARVDGVELAAELAAVARRNLARMAIRNSTIYCADAAAFTQLDAYGVVYMYNPFHRHIMESALANLVASVRRRPRRVLLIYKTPICEAAVIAAGFERIRTFDGEMPTSIYQIL